MSANDPPNNRWTKACTTWLSGDVPTQDIKYTIQNFFTVTRARPSEKEVEINQSDENLSDVDLEVDAHNLEDLLITRPGGKQGSLTRKADDHHDNAVAAIAYARERWHVALNTRPQSAKQKLPATTLNTKDMLAAASTLRRASEADASVRSYLQQTATGAVEVRQHVTLQEVHEWLERNVHGPDCQVSSAQASFIEEVARRFYDEQFEGNAHGQTTKEPMRKLVHGKPGTGKSSKCIGLAVRFFEEVAKYKRGVHYHICTLQAFLASKLGGQTSHSLAGLNPFISVSASDDVEEKAKESVQLRFLLCRWILEDEAFMKSAQ